MSRRWPSYAVETRETTNAETRTRYQMLLLSLRGQTSSQIAQNVLRSQDTVVRVLKRFFTGGLDAVPRRTDPGRERRVTAAWEAERLAKEHLHLIYTPAYDPDANRHSHGTGLVSRRVVTHNHHRGTFELLQRVLDYVHRHIETKRNGEESPCVLP